MLTQNMRKLASRATIGLSLAPFLAACSASYMEKDGTRYIFGPAIVRVAEASETSSFVQPAIEIRTFGLAVLNGETGTGVSFGWMRLREGRLRDSAANLDVAAATNTSPVSRHIVWTYMRLPPADPAKLDAGTVGDVTTVGLAVTTLGNQSGLSLGYGRSGLASIADNVVVAGNPLQLLDRQFAHPSEYQTGGIDD
jgi:hypothetical protein